MQRTEKTKYKEDTMYCIIGKFESCKDGFIVVLSQIGRNYAVEIIEKGEKPEQAKPLTGWKTRIERLKNSCTGACLVFIPAGRKSNFC
jgi:hypothetical protein